MTSLKCIKYFFPLGLLVCATWVSSAFSEDLKWTTIEWGLQDSIKIDSIEYINQNVFDDVNKYTEAERMAYGWANNLHIPTKKTLIQKLITFEPGQNINKEQIDENERILRGQRYLADAQIKLFQNAEGKIKAQVKTSDKWTLSVPLSLAKPSNKWTYSYGLLDFNFLGYGYELGGAVVEGQVRAEKLAFFRDPNFFVSHQEFYTSYNYIQDGLGPAGYSVDLQLQRPFYALKTKYAWSAQWNHQKSNDYLFNPQGGKIVATYTAIPQDTVGIRLSKSFGEQYKQYFRISYDGYWRENAVKKIVYKSKSSDTLKQTQYDLDAQNTLKIEPWTRNDGRLGVYYTFRKPEYIKLTNFKSAKWTEDVDIGWQMGVGLSKNSEAFGSDNSNWRLDQHLNTLKRLSESNWFELNSRNYVYIPRLSKLDRNHFEFFKGGQSLSYRYKPPVGHLSTVMLWSLGYLINAPRSEQVTAGGSSGWAGVPEYGYAGHAIQYAELEERYMPGFEWGTILPSFAVFVNGGKAWAGIQDMEFKDLDYRVGGGLRLALSKSAQGIVNHLNVAYPLNGSEKGNLTTSIIAKIGF